MALTSGTKPTSYSSELTGLAKEIYDSKKGVSIPTEDAIVSTVGGETFTESDSDRQNRILKAKLDAWCAADGIVKNLKADAEINTPLIPPNPPIILETYAAGVGTNGGSLVAAPYPVSGAINLPPATYIGKIN